MRVVSHLNAMMMVNAPWDEVRPIEGGPYTVVVEALKQHYKFQSAGLSVASQQMQLTTPHLQTGQFEYQGQPTVVNQVEFQPTNISVSCATTDQAEAFFNDLMKVLQTFGYRPPPADRVRKHITTIISEFKQPIAKMFKALADIQAILASKGEIDLDPVGFRFISKVDPQTLLQRQFLFEVRASSPIGTEWIFSQAPLKSEDHVDLLNEIEKKFAA